MSEVQKMDQKGFKWEFEALDESDYRIILTYYADSNLFKTLLAKTKSRLEKKKGIKIPEGVLEQFTLPENQKKHMIPVITKATKKNVVLVFREVKKDGVICIGGKVLDVYYNKISTHNWEIKVFVKGQYRFQ